MIYRYVCMRLKTMAGGMAKIYMETHIKSKAITRDITQAYEIKKRQDLHKKYAEDQKDGIAYCAKAGGAMI